MAVTVETLEKLERRITLLIPATDLNSEIETRLKKLSRTVKADGFRPGKVPMSVVAQRYGYSVQYEVMNDKLGQAFASAANEAQLRVAGQPRITEKEGAAEGEVAFDAVFEVYPEVKIGDLATAEVEKLSTEVSEAAIDRTVDGFHARVVQHEVDHLDGVLYPMRIRDMGQFGFTEILFPELAAFDDD